MISDGLLRISAALLLGVFLTSSEDAGALELTGAWAASADQCGKVFTRRGRANAIAFAGLSERHGSGFIIEADRIRGKFTTCMIKARKEEGQTLNLIAGCATDIILSNVQFSLKVLDENSIARQFPGMDGSEVRYFRCSI
jgi:hypothetical protein